MLVLLGHLRGTRGLGTFELGVGDFAHLGVLVFFVISGFLITSLLLAEEAKTGSVSLKRFYARRSLRIFPVSYSYIALIGILSLVGSLHAATNAFWYAVTYTMNCVSGAPWVLGHLWSLSVEEQFSQVSGKVLCSI
jgi:peptidoglycan/LPS O-acetylase OafA/YrhL